MHIRHQNLLVKHLALQNKTHFPSLKVGQGAQIWYRGWVSIPLAMRKKLIVRSIMSEKNENECSERVGRGENNGREGQKGYD